MVLAALCEQLLPSHRGLIRNHESLAAGNDDRLWEQHHYHHSDNNINHVTNHNPTGRQNVGNYNGNSIMDLSQPENDETEPQQSPEGLFRMENMPSAAAATRRKRNGFRASKFLASVAADFDVITDWLFYAQCYSENKEYYNGEGMQQNYKIPPWMVGLVLTSCVIGTTLWVILATDGAIAAPVLRFLGYDKLSLGHMLLACVLLEDIPQVVLTFYIEDYFEGDQEFTNYAVMNVVVSLYDTLIKLAEAFDQRAGTSILVIYLFRLTHSKWGGATTHDAGLIFVVIVIISISILKLLALYYMQQKTSSKRGTGVRKVSRRTTQR
jgi:hypothetical protein